MWACVVNEHILNMLSKGIFLNWKYILINGLQVFIRLIKITWKLIGNCRFLKNISLDPFRTFFFKILFIEHIVLQIFYQT
jgi:hypothetical protein